ncbi:MAG: glycosyltransferase family 39 protein [Flavobacteriales bacterium]|nr:glycosyltransferase family 39 protein [Flavobacteriales bacterium]
MDRLMQLYRSVGPRWVFVIGFLTFSAIYEYGRVLHLRPLPMHIWRQADCLSLTWNYYTGEATFLKPVIHGQIADGGESGLSAGEFPLLYWAMGQVWKVIGPSEFAYRLFGLLFHFVASYMLFLTLRRLLRSDFWAIGITLLLFTSPVLLYYGVSFLTDVPAFDLALMGWYFFVRHAEEGKRRWWILSTACFALATLLKVTAGMSFVAIIGLYLLFTVRPAWFRSIPKVFPSRVFGWAVIAISLAGIAAWYIHAEQFNTDHAGRYTFNNLWPIWEMSPDEIDRAVTFAKRILLFQIFDTSVLLLIGLAIILLIVHVRELPHTRGAAQWSVDPWRDRLYPVLVPCRGWPRLLFHQSDGRLACSTCDLALVAMQATSGYLSFPMAPGWIHFALVLQRGLCTDEPDHAEQSEQPSGEQEPVANLPQI